MNLFPSEVDFRITVSNFHIFREGIGQTLNRRVQTMHRRCKHYFALTVSTYFFYSLIILCYLYLVHRLYLVRVGWFVCDDVWLKDSRGTKAC